MRLLLKLTAASRRLYCTQRQSITPLLHDIRDRYQLYTMSDKHTQPMFADDPADRRTVSEMAPLASRIHDLDLVVRDLSDLENMAAQCEGMEEDIQQERGEYNRRKDVLYDEIIELLVPLQTSDDRDVSLEVTAGVGGEEASLFTGELFEMYQKYALFRGWSFEIQQCEFNDGGGMRKATAVIGGSEAFRRLKFEGGVHRVQRNPKTERSGRVHTSTSAVAVLPVPNEVDVVINPKDLRIDTFKSSGSGGQHVNTTDSAVRVTHIPTGTVSECQTTRCQHKNKANAIESIRTKIYEAKLEQQTKMINASRRLQFGSSSRSDKIRTYNFPQDRVTDHRLRQSHFDIATFMNGADNLDEFIENLLQIERDETIDAKLSLYLKKNKAK